VAFHARLDYKQRNAVAQFYGDAATKMLRVALSKGYKDVVHTEKDTALAPLRAGARPQVSHLCRKHTAFRAPTSNETTVRPLPLTKSLV
jgi:hypothetical protein